MQQLLEAVHAGVTSLRCGPAAHILAVSVVVLAAEESAIPALLKLGGVDAGDLKTTTGDSRQQQQKLKVG